MTETCILDWKSIHTIVFDFDGVFTDNKVWVDQNGIESVRCDRSDGLAFDMLRSFMGHKKWEVDYFILSKETNPVVASRAKKMNIPCVQSISDKATYLSSYLEKNNKSSDGMVFLGNDLNDLGSIRIAGLSVAPSDGHPIIRNQVDLVLKERGGEGFVRAFIEILLGVDIMSPEDFISQNII